MVSLLMFFLFSFFLLVILFDFKAFERFGFILGSSLIIVENGMNGYGRECLLISCVFEEDLLFCPRMSLFGFTRMERLCFKFGSFLLASYFDLVK